MSAKYSRVPSVDPELGHDISLDFGSDFTYNNPGQSSKKYRSIFSYGDSRHQMDQSISIVKQSLCSRVCELIVIGVSFVLCILTFPISAWKSFKVVSECERLVVFRLGKLQGSKGPGIVFIVPCIDTWKKVDVRIKAFNVPPLQIITLDRGIIEMGADVYYNISDVVKTVTTVQDLNSSIRALLRNVLMNHVVKYEMDQVEAQKYNIVADVMAACNKTCAGWGVSISKIEFSPIKILQSPKPGANIPGFGSEGVSQVFQQIAQSFMPGGAGQSFTPQPLTVSERRPDPSGAAAVGHEDINLLPAPSPRDILALVQAVMSETLVRAVGAVYEFSLSGANGGVYYLDLKHGSGSIGEGHDPRRDPDVNLDLSVQDMQQMFMGHLKPLQAYMSGRLKVSGDLSAAMRLEEVLERIKSLTNSSGNVVINI